MIHLIEMTVPDRTKWGDVLSLDFVLPAKMHRLRGVLVNVVPSFSSLVCRRLAGSGRINIVDGRGIVSGAEELFVFSAYSDLPDALAALADSTELADRADSFPDAYASYAAGGVCSALVGTGSMALDGTPVVTTSAVVTSGMAHSSFGHNVVRFEPVAATAGQILRVSIEEVLTCPFLTEATLDRHAEELHTAFTTQFYGDRSEVIAQADIDKAVALYFLRHGMELRDGGREGDVLDGTADAADIYYSLARSAYGLGRTDATTNSYTAKFYIEYD